MRNGRVTAPSPERIADLDVVAGHVYYGAFPTPRPAISVLALLSPRASAALDRALRYERMIYEAAVVVHDRRCVEHLGSERCAARGGRAPR